MDMFLKAQTSRKWTSQNILTPHILTFFKKCPTMHLHVDGVQGFVSCSSRWMIIVSLQADAVGNKTENPSSIIISVKARCALKFTGIKEKTSLVKYAHTDVV